MSHAARFFWVCAATATLCFVALVVLTFGTLQPEGLQTFDARFFGYSVVDARTYLIALGKVPDATLLYLTTFRQLDTAFPILLAVSIAGAVWLNTTGGPLILRICTLALPFGYLLLDLGENRLVAQLLNTGPTVADRMIEHADLATRAKWGVLALSGLALLALWQISARKERNT